MSQCFIGRAYVKDLGIMSLKYPCMNLPGENYGFFSELLGEGSLHMEMTWCWGKVRTSMSSFREQKLEGYELAGISETRVPNPTLRHPEQALFKSCALQDIAVKRRLSRTLLGLWNTNGCVSISQWDARSHEGQRELLTRHCPCKQLFIYLLGWQLPRERASPNCWLKTCGKGTNHWADRTSYQEGRVTIIPTAKIFGGFEI